MTLSVNQLSGFGGLAVQPLNISNATIDSDTMSFAAQDTDSDAVYVSPDGTKLFLTLDTSNAVGQYNMSTPYTLSSATYFNQFSHSAQFTTQGVGISFTRDGLRMILLEASVNRTVAQYNLTTPFNVTTASYSGNSKILGATSPSASSMTMTPDGLNLYVFDGLNDSIDQYSMSTAGDISSLTSVGTLSVSAVTTAGTSLFITEDGYDVLVGTNSDLHQFRLGTAFSISTGSLFVTKTGLGTPDGVCVDASNTKMVVPSGTSVNRYSL